MLPIKVSSAPSSVLVTKLTRRSLLSPTRGGMALQSRMMPKLHAPVLYTQSYTYMCAHFFDRGAVKEKRKIKGIHW